MNIFSGSLQTKNGWFYFVFRVSGKQKWVALKTRSLTVAKRWFRILRFLA